MVKLPPHITTRISNTPIPEQIPLPAYYDALTRTERVRVRERYMEQQGGKCAHCGEPLEGPCADHVSRDWINWNLFPPGFMNNQVHLHHDHKTGLTIGAIHAYCNAWLWQYRKE